MSESSPLSVAVDVLHPVQRRSHVDLLIAPQTRFDAIIVPSARPAPALTHVMKLAARHRCPVLVLCSRESRAKNVVEHAAKYNATAVAIDVTGQEPLQPRGGWAGHVPLDRRDPVRDQE